MSEHVQKVELWIVIADSENSFYHQQVGQKKQEQGEMMEDSEQHSGLHTLVQRLCVVFLCAKIWPPSCGALLSVTKAVSVTELVWALGTICLCSSFNLILVSLKSSNSQCFSLFKTRILVRTTS